jgi:hypothetical protein
MTRQATPKAIEAYREKLLTNPVTFGARLRAVREDLRARSEVLFIDRDLTADDKAVDEEGRTAEFERIDEQILRVGARIDDLDQQIEAHNKAHPDAELAAKLMEAPPPGAAMNRQHRREIGQQRARAAAKAEKAPAAEDVPAEEPTAEETPKAE